MAEVADGGRRLSLSVPPALFIIFLTRRWRFLAGTLDPSRGAGFVTFIQKALVFVVGGAVRIVHEVRPWGGSANLVKLRRAYRK